jgi:hypothetical protein
MKRALTVLLTVATAAALLGCARFSTTRSAPAWQPKDPPMLTRWAQDINPARPLPEYPRPQLTRADWQNLNGLWHYAVTPKTAPAPSSWDGQILVPYPIESALSGVKRALQPEEILYYQRTFQVPRNWDGRRLRLHFGAVDYRSEIFVNGRRVGTHAGGYDPFSFDITDYLNREGLQTLLVKVTDPTWTEGIPRGKQTLKPDGIMYTPTSGIWQTVWLEPVAAGGIAELHIVPDLKSKSVHVTATLHGQAEGEVTVHAAGAAVTGRAGSTIVVPVKSPKLWSPEKPHLYDLQVCVTRQGQLVDQVGSYFGMRSIEMARVDGVMRLLLNGQPYFMFGPLDQGFWPDGLYTAPTDAALKYDLEVTKQLGFNTTRKHIKVEPARWYYHADKLGLLVWQDMPSINSYDTPPGGKPPIDRQAYATQLEAMIRQLKNHPAIVMWVVFNESQGKHDTEKLVQLVRQLDPTRLVNEDSGYQDHGGPYLGVSDLHDLHPYPAPRAFTGPADKAFALGEYGGIGLKIGANNPWQKAGWGYTTTQTSEELENLYASYAGLIRKFRDENGLTAAIYTQITDVEIEINGLLTYDRQLKVNPKWIAKANRFEWRGPVFTSLVPTSQTAPAEYQYTFTTPGADWMLPQASTSGWRTGPGGFGTPGTPGIGKIGTPWNTSNLWVRRTFTLPQLTEQQLQQLMLNVHHDEDVKIYLNGILAVDKPGWVSNYTPVAISAAARAALNRGGTNVMAIHCRQTVGGQFLDVGLGLLDSAR